MSFGRFFGFVSRDELAGAMKKASGEIELLKQKDIELQAQIDALKPSEPIEPVKAFPSVKGAGENVTGGRGGKVVYVTTTQDMVSGSLREALLMQEPRIIVFAVSGNFRLTDELELTEANSNFTVAGQTAPQGGVTITNDFIRIGGGWSRPNSACNNGIFRYVRFRNARYTGQADNPRHNGVTVVGCDGLVFDHCSFAFNDDQALNMDSKYGDLKNVTVQKCIFSENATGIIAGLQGEYERKDMTFVDNLFVDQTHRTPNIGGNGRFDVINNVFFNWKSRLVNINAGNPDVNFIGNYLRPGSFTESGSANQVQNRSPKIYNHNNQHTEGLQGVQLWQRFPNAGALPGSVFTTQMHDLLGHYEILDPQQAYVNILADVGASKYLRDEGYSMYRDSFDTVKVNNVANGISSDPKNKNWTLPNIPNNTRPIGYDTEMNGVSDVWQSKNMPEGANVSDIAPNGYTYIENFLNQVDE